MAWGIGTGPGAYEAFRRRALLTTPELLRHQDLASQRAFWVANAVRIEQLRVAQDVLAMGIEDRTDPETLADLLQTALDGIQRHHAETVAINAVASAYAAERWEQMYAPEARRRRPFGRFRGVRDARQTQICRSVDGKSYPLDHPIWLTGSPPRHHRCRTEVVPISRAEYNRLRPEDQGPLDIDDAAPGWGLRPDLAPEYTPDLTDMQGTIRDRIREAEQAWERRQRRNARDRARRARNRALRHQIPTVRDADLGYLRDPRSMRPGSMQYWLEMAKTENPTAAMPITIDAQRTLDGVWTYTIRDGRHRYQAAALGKYTSIFAEVHTAIETPNGDWVESDMFEPLSQEIPLSMTAAQRGGMRRRVNRVR